MLLTAYRPGVRTPVIRRLNDQQLSPFSLIDEVFPEFFTTANTVRNAEGQLVLAAQARFDVVEKSDRYEAFVELPGVSKQDIEVDIDGNRVNVKAEAKTEHNADQNLKDGERVIYSERRATLWSRSFELPVEVAEERAEAHYENGVLKLVLPKKEIVQAKRLQIN